MDFHLSVLLPTLLSIKLAHGLMVVELWVSKASSQGIAYHEFISTTRSIVDCSVPYVSAHTS